PYRAQLTESMPESRLSPLLEDLVPRLEPKEHLETHGAAPRGSFTSGGAVAPAAPDLLYKHRSVPVQQPTGAQGTGSSGTPRQNLGHVLALTGISLANERLIPYGLFIIAEAVGSPRSGKASRRAVELIAEQIAPLLANDQALESEQLATLLQLAITRASLDLRKQCIRTATDLTVAVTGVMVLGGSVHVINVGHCRTYIFRPKVGLRQITADHSVVSRLVDNGLLAPEALYMHPRRDQIYRSVGDNQTPEEIDTFEIDVHPD